jgi:hypothetical protein
MKYAPKTLIFGRVYLPNQYPVKMYKYWQGNTDIQLIDHKETALKLPLLNMLVLFLQEVES